MTKKTIERASTEGHDETDGENFICRVEILRNKTCVGILAPISLGMASSEWTVTVTICEQTKNSPFRDVSFLTVVSIVSS